MNILEIIGAITLFLIAVIAFLIMGDFLSVRVKKGEEKEDE